MIENALISYLFVIIKIKTIYKIYTHCNTKNSKSSLKKKNMIILIETHIETLGG